MLASNLQRSACLCFLGLKACITTGGVESGGLEIEGYPHLHSEFKNKPRLEEWKYVCHSESSPSPSQLMCAFSFSSLLNFSFFPSRKNHKPFRFSFHPFLDSFLIFSPHQSWCSNLSVISLRVDALSYKCQPGAVLSTVWIADCAPSMTSVAMVTVFCVP